MGDDMSSPGRWFFLEQGAGPPLLLLHGLGASSFSWRHNLTPLSQHFRVLTLDLPAHGRTPATAVPDFRLETLTQAICQLLEEHNIRRTAVAGNSLGGSLALLLAREYPERISALMLLAPGAALKRAPFLFYPLRLPGLGLLVAACLGPWILPPALKLIFYRPELITREVLEGYAVTFRPLANRLAIRRLAQQVDRWPLPKVENLLRQIPQPTLLLWGQEDRILRVSQARWIKARLPQAEMQVLPAVGHAPQEEAPETVNKILIDFLSRSLKN